jgi:hypothetical protein
MVESPGVLGKEPVERGVEAGEFYRFGYPVS